MEGSTKGVSAILAQTFPHNPVSLETLPKSLTALLPASELGARFCHWFNHGWHWIYAIREKPHIKPQWLTETRYRLEPRNLWKAYQDSHKYKLIGLRFDSETRYCLIDIDRGSPYHPANNFSGFKDVHAALEEIGLTRPVDVRSSESEGIHVYYFLPKALPTFALACAIRVALENAGLKLRSGELESFPNVKAYSKHKYIDYNGHRLPLQSGSYLLDNDAQPLTDDLKQFLDTADAAAAGQDLPTLLKAIADSEGSHLNFIHGKSRRAEEWKRDLEQRITPGWTAPGQTNFLIKDMVAYGNVFLHLSGEALIDYVEATAKAAPGYEQYCDHKHEIRQRAQHWESARERNEYYSEYPSYPNRRGTYRQTFGSEAINNVTPFKSNLNEQRSNEATDRVRQAVSHLKELGKLPAAIAARAKAIVDTAKKLFGKGVSMLTLRKLDYLKLWHPKYYEDGSIAHSSTQSSIDCEIQPEIQSLTSSTEKKNGGIASGLESTGLSGVINLEAHSVTQNETSAVTQDLKQDVVIQTEVFLELPPANDSVIWITPPLCSIEEQRQPKSPELSQSLDCSSLDHTPPLNEGRGADGGQPHAHSVQGTPPIPPLEISSTPLEISSTPLLFPRRDPSTDDCHIDCHTPAAPAASTPRATAPAAPTTVATPPAASGWSVPSGADEETIRRQIRIRLDAMTRAKKAVKMQESIERRLFTPTEREHRETVARMEFLWRSGEPELMEDVRRWLAADPSRSLNL